MQGSGLWSFQQAVNACSTRRNKPGWQADRFKDIAYGNHPGFLTNRARCLILESQERNVRSGSVR